MMQEIFVGSLEETLRLS